MSPENDTWQYFSKLWDELDEKDEFYNHPGPKAAPRPLHVDRWVGKDPPIQ
jgi:hypothetical protein